MRVRDLIEQLQAHPPECRLRLTVECLDGKGASADAFDVRRREDAVELNLSGALVRPLVANDETAQDEKR